VTETLISLQDWFDFIGEYAGRGRLTEPKLGSVLIKVPAWKVCSIRREAAKCTPIALDVTVERLSFGDHFSLKEVTWEYNPNLLST
jgi:hypothetical protein